MTQHRPVTGQLPADAVPCRELRWLDRLRSVSISRAIHNHGFVPFFRKNGESGQAGQPFSSGNGRGQAGPGSLGVGCFNHNHFD